MIGFIMMFFMPNSRFRKLIARLHETRKEAGKILLVLLIFSLPMMGNAQEATSDRVAEALESNVVPKEHAARFGALPVQFRGRVMPMNTFASEILRKVHKEKQFGELDPNQFLLSFFALPQMWSNVPFIAVSNEEVRARYDLPEGHATYASFFDEQGQYRLLTRLQEIHHRPVGERSAADKELINLDGE